MSDVEKGYGARAVRQRTIKDSRVKRCKIVWKMFSSSAISKHIKQYNVDLSESICKDAKSFRSFCDYYARELKPEARVFDAQPDVLTSPCDGWISAHFINSFSLIPQNDNLYSIEKLLGGSVNAKEFAEGFAIIIQLDEADVHSFSFFDGGTVCEKKRLAAEKDKNSAFIFGDRMCSIIKTDNFNTAAQIEICGNPKGIEQYDIDESHMVSRGRLKGRFICGNAAVVMLFKKGTIHPDDEILVNTGAGRQTRVLAGERIGMAISH